VVDDVIVTSRDFEATDFVPSFNRSFAFGTVDGVTPIGGCESDLDGFGCEDCLRVLVADGEILWSTAAALVTTAAAALVAAAVDFDD
jgi:hypothetical protein